MIRLPKNPLTAIFAIVRVQEEPELHYSFLGTGFFIDNSGLFFTAKHVCKSMENECKAVMIGSSADKNPTTSYQISNLRYSEEFDIALGEVGGVRGIHALAIATENAPMNLDILTAEFSGTYSKQLEDGEKAIVLRPYFRKGQVLSYYKSTWPQTVNTTCLELSFPALKGASGAPIIVEDTGLVIGMIVGNIERELLPAQIERVTIGQKYIEEIKYLLPSAIAIGWEHLNDLLNATPWGHRSKEGNYTRKGRYLGMKAKNYHNYRIKLRDRQIISIERNGQKIESFVEPDNHSQLPKLYIVKSGSEVIYIGQTTQNMRTRLRQGLKAQGEHGYYGYMWKDLPEVNLLIWCFPNRIKSYVETIEGELVFLFRKCKGKWPERQTEIHFHNASKDEIKVAEVIYEEACR